MWLARGAAAWLLIAALEVLQGVARSLWLAPTLGDAVARRLALPLALTIVLAVALLTVRWIGAHGLKQWLLVGVLWAAAMAGFDLLVGRYIAGYSWARIAADFNLAAGGLLGLAMLPIVVAPLLAARLRRADR